MRKPAKEFESKFEKEIEEVARAIAAKAPAVAEVGVVELSKESKGETYISRKESTSEITLPEISEQFSKWFPSETFTTETFSKLPAMITKEVLETSAVNEIRGNLCYMQELFNKKEITGDLQVGVGYTREHILKQVARFHLDEDTIRKNFLLLNEHRAEEQPKEILEDVVNYYLDKDSIIKPRPIPILSFTQYLNNVGRYKRTKALKEISGDLHSLKDEITKTRGLLSKLMSSHAVCESEVSKLRSSLLYGTWDREFSKTELRDEHEDINGMKIKDRKESKVGHEEDTIKRERD